MTSLRFVLVGLVCLIATSASMSRIFSRSSAPISCFMHGWRSTRPSTSLYATTVRPSVKTPSTTTRSTVKPNPAYAANVSYVHTDAKVNEQGLPLVYDPTVIRTFWDERPSEMNKRWSLFISVTAPFLTRLVKEFTQGTILQNEKGLARDLRIVLEKLGPTFVKLGQALSIRPDVIGPAATEELAKLQDAVKPFDTKTAYALIEQELGRPISEVFSEISPEPLAAASLAQVYKARLVENGEYVAVKVQRPEMLALVSKDLYVMKRAVDVYQKYIVERFTAQKTNYQELLSVWATGFYQELDFLNEATNQMKMKEYLKDIEGIYVPKVYTQYSSRTLLISEWIDGIKLTQASKAEVRELTKIAQEAFLMQLLDFGYLHADPHPGNLILMDDKSKGQLAILDYGLVAELSKDDMEGMVSALIHTANKDFPRLIDDLVDLNVLPKDIDRAKVEPIMKRVISPYVFQGGGAKNLNYQSLAKDLGQATLEIPFSIPPYFALVARALGILEGIALTGDEDYRIVLESYPYVTRRLMTDKSPRLQQALNEILYNNSAEKISFRRLASLLAYAMNVKNENGVETVFVDFDEAPSTAARLDETMRFLLNDQASPLRQLLVVEIAQAADLFLRKAFRRSIDVMQQTLRLPAPPFLPKPPSLFFVPSSVVDALAPSLTVEEEIYLKSVSDLGFSVLGNGDIQDFDDLITRPDKFLQALLKTDRQVIEDFRLVLPVLDPNKDTGKNAIGVGTDVGRILYSKLQERMNVVLRGGAVGAPSVPSSP